MTNFTPVKLKRIGRYTFPRDLKGGAEFHETLRAAEDKGYTTDYGFASEEVKFKLFGFIPFHYKKSVWLLEVFEKVDAKR